MSFIKMDKFRRFDIVVRANESYQTRVLQCIFFYQLRVLQCILSNESTLLMLVWEIIFQMERTQIK